MNLFTLYDCDIHDVSGAIFSSVVPPINFMMVKALTRLLGKPPMMVGAGIKTGLNIRMEFNSQQLGPILSPTPWPRWKNTPRPSS